MEPYFINLYETYWETGKGYNMTRGGEGIWGHKMSDESKKLMSIRQKKRFEDPIELERLRLQATGRKQSHQEKNKRSKSLKKYYETHDGPWTGKEFTKEHKANLSKARIGKSPTKETCSKISSSNSSKWEVTFPDNHKEIVKNLREFCRLNNLCTENLWKTSKGLIHKSEGFSAKKLLCDGFN